MSLLLFALAQVDTTHTANASPPDTPIYDFQCQIYSHDGEGTLLEGTVREGPDSKVDILTNVILSVKSGSAKFASVSDYHHTLHTAKRNQIVGYAKKVDMRTTYIFDFPTSKQASVPRASVTVFGQISELGMSNKFGLVATGICDLHDVKAAS